MAATLTPAVAPVVPAGAPLPGIYRGVKLAAYHAWPLPSNSRLGRLKRSPAHLRAYLSQPEKQTAATLLGNAIHCAVLEPDDFDARYCIAEQCDAKTKEGKRCSNNGIYWHSELGWACGVHGRNFPAENPRTVMAPEDYMVCVGVRDSLFAPGTLTRKLLTGEGEIELSAVFPAFETDVLCKVRFDRHTPVIAGGVIVDLKSARDASRREFERSIFAHGYHRQGALYEDAAKAVQLGAEHFVHIAVEKTPPYAAALYRLTESALAAGREELQSLLRRYVACVERDEWPAYPNEVQDIALPAYAWSQIDEDLNDEE